MNLKKAKKNICEGLEGEKKEEGNDIIIISKK